MRRWEDDIRAFGQERERAWKSVARDRLAWQELEDKYVEFAAKFRG